MLSLISQILKNSPRQFEGEKKTRNFILDFLKKSGFPFKIQSFSVELPQFQRYFLLADGKKIKSLPCGLKSGRIESKEYLSNPLRDSAIKGEKAIIFNPLCQDISLHTFYFAPALAIRAKDVFKILRSKKISGYLKIKKIKHPTVNILVGNLRNPKSIVFTHYDSIERGAVDNASGVAVALKMIEENFFKKNLFVLSGCEELSFEEPIYWGYGYRVFEKEYKRLLNKSQKLVVVDTVGNGKPVIFDKNNFSFLKLAFPLKSLEEKKGRVFLVAGDINKAMRVYHSNLDGIKEVKLHYLEEALKETKNLLREG